MQEDARIWIGSSTANGLSALFTDLATERTTLVEAFEDTDEWYVDAPQFFIIGHTYSVELTVGITPVQFYPYLWDGSSFVADTTLVDGVNFDVVKVWEADGDTYYTSSDQHLSIP